MSKYYNDMVDEIETKVSFEDELYDAEVEYFKDEIAAYSEYQESLAWN